MDLSRLRHQLTNFAGPSPFAEPTAVDHAAMYADAVVHLLIEGGPAQVTMSKVAKWMRQVPSAVVQRAEGREGFLRLVVGRFGRRWERWVCLVAREPVDLIRLPESEDEVHGIRVWSCLYEIAAGEARAGRTDLAEMTAGVRDRHREAIAVGLARLLGRRPSETEVTLVECLGNGLRDAIAAPVDPLDPAEAAQVVAWATHHLFPSD